MLYDGPEAHHYGPDLLTVGFFHRPPLENLKSPSENQGGRRKCEERQPDRTLDMRELRG